MYHNNIVSMLKIHLCRSKIEQVVATWFDQHGRVFFSMWIGFATRSENFNEIVSVTSYLRKTIATIAFVNDFFQGGRVEPYLVS